MARSAGPDSETTDNDKSTQPSLPELPKKQNPLHGSLASAQHTASPGVPAINMKARRSNNAVGDSFLHDHPQHESRARELFEALDHEKLGYLTQDTLQQHPNPPTIALSDLIRLADRNSDGRLSYEEFRQYMRIKESELATLFLSISRSSTTMSATDLKAAFHKAGIEISEEQLDRFVARIDRSSDGVIDFQEWRDFFTYLPKEPSIHSVYRFFMRLEDEGESESEQLEVGSQAMYLICGGVAGAVSRTCTAPCDRVRVYLQTRTSQNSGSQLKRVSSAIRDIYATQGRGSVFTFWRGNALNCVKIVPESAIKFYVFERMKRLLSEGRKGNGSPQTYDRFLAGGIAGAISQVCIYPIETVKTRMMSAFVAEGIDRPKPPEPSQLDPRQRPVVSHRANACSPQRFHCATHSRAFSAATCLHRRDYLRLSPTLDVLSIVRNMYRESGPRAFFRGLGPSLFGIVPYAGIDLGIYETLKTWHIRFKAKRQHKSEHDIKPSVLVLLGSGTVSGAVSACTVYPLSVIRTRLQAQGSPGHPELYSGMLDVIKKTYNRERLGGFYKGLVPALAKVIPAASISYVVYEGMKTTLCA